MKREICGCLLGVGVSLAIFAAIYIIAAIQEESREKKLPVTVTIEYDPSIEHVRTSNASLGKDKPCKIKTRYRNRKDYDDARNTLLRFAE